MTKAKNSKTEYYMVLTCMEIGISAPGERLPFIPTYLVKMVGDKCEDIIDINHWRADSYLEYAAPSYSADRVKVPLSDRSEFICRDEVIDYAKKAKILKNKLKGRNMDYIIQAASHLATAPKEAAKGYEGIFRRAGARSALSWKEQWEEAKMKEQDLFNFADKIAEILKKRQQRADDKMADSLQNKARTLDSGSEFVAFFEEDEQKAHDEKAIVRRERYKDMLEYDKMYKALREKRDKSH